MILSMSLPDHRILRELPGAPCRVGPPGPQPGASAAGRGEAQRSRLDLNTARFGNASPVREAKQVVAKGSDSARGESLGPDGSRTANLPLIRTFQD